MANSIYGNPKGLMAIEKDTFHAKMQQLGTMNNMLFTIDELTNMKNTDASDMAYSASQGRWKNRAKNSENGLRINNTTWQNMTLCSSNASLYEKLGLLKKSPDGESMRIFEYEIAPNDLIDVDTGKLMFDQQLNENYGHAGEIFITYLVNNLESCIALLKKVKFNK
jgi:uncharacterized protein (DUF927 family)